ncbi:energy transducer TonB [Trinickia violacea]|uniref:energy transducer TonB n=1 Tax=Trinickia violacea TaxID=2571746 RepID=UPI001C2F48E3|nr:energy transducer TonB [Trinickia violacea]
MISGAHGPQGPAAASNTVVTGRLASLPIASPLPRIASQPPMSHVPTQTSRLAASNEPTSVAPQHGNRLTQRHARVEAALAARFAATHRTHLAVVRRSAPPPDGPIDRERATRLAFLQSIAGSPTLEGGLPRTENVGSVSPGYADKVAKRVRANVLAPFAIRGDRSAVIAVTCAPTGALLSVTLRRSSGNPQWDSAALNAVEKTDPMPADLDGTTPTSFLIAFQPKG